MTEQFDAYVNSILEACWKNYKQVGMKKKGKRKVPNCVPKTVDESAAWQRKEGKNPEGGLNKKGVESYRKENPGSKLQTAVTTDPSKLKKGSKSAKRRKSFCARSTDWIPEGGCGNKETRGCKARRKWNC
jgi:hypothetical protein